MSYKDPEDFTRGDDEAATERRWAAASRRLELDLAELSACSEPRTP